MTIKVLKLQKLLKHTTRLIDLSYDRIVSSYNQLIVQSILEVQVMDIL